MLTEISSEMYDSWDGLCPLLHNREQITLLSMHVPEQRTSKSLSQANESMLIKYLQGVRENNERNKTDYREYIGIG